MKNELKNYIQSLNDPIARKTKWHLHKITHKQFLRMPNSETRLIADTHDSQKILIKPSLKNIILNDGLYLAILTIFFIPFFSALFSYPSDVLDQERPIFIAFYYFSVFCTLIIAYFTIYMLMRITKFSSDPAYFDIYKKAFISGDAHIDFSDIHAVQIVTGSDKRGHIIGIVWVQNTTQIHLILNDASRIPICIENNILRSRNIAAEIARLTGAQLWDATNYPQK